MKVVSLIFGIYIFSYMEAPTVGPKYFLNCYVSYVSQVSFNRTGMPYGEKQAMITCSTKRLVMGLL